MEAGGKDELLASRRATWMAWSSLAALPQALRQVL